MLIATNMLNELKKDTIDECMSDNDDFDFGTVLSYCSTPTAEHKLRCSDGQKRTFSFDN